MENYFRALMVDKMHEDVSLNFKEIKLGDLPQGDVLIKVHYSSVNFKDGLASMPNGKIVQSYPFVPGIDLAGKVVSSKDSRFQEGDPVIATSYDIGVSHYGGYSEYARIPADWIVPLPDALSLKEAMIYGTAGFTAALSILRLEENGLTPEKGKVLVTGATGGVGSIAVAILNKLGYDVVASTGKEKEHDFLKELGAKEVITREEVCPEKIRPLDKQLWAGAVDPVGGQTLAAIISRLQYQGSVAVSGLTAGTNVSTTVFPFILRGINILGIDSVYCPMEKRKELWYRMASDFKPNNLEYIGNEIEFKELPYALSTLLKGKARGRQVVKI